MFNLQVTLSDFRPKKRQSITLQSFIIVLRFGSIKLDIKIAFNGQQFIGGKRIVLDLTSDDLKNMFLNYALGLFIQNQLGKFFSILSLQKLNFNDIVSGQEVYFYNDNQQIVYSANFSFIFNDFKNPRMPNKQKVQNHKTFNQFFKKPAIPNHNVQGKTMSSFLYGKNNLQKQKLSSTTGMVPKSKPTNAKPKSSRDSTKNKQSMKKTNQIVEYNAIKQPQFQIHKFYDNNQQIQDDNPPVMQFTNTVNDALKGVNLLKTQMTQLNEKAPQTIKFMTAYDSKNGFIKTKSKQTRNTINKIQQKLNKNQTTMNGSTTSFKQNIDSFKINRDELRNKAKKQMQNYQGNTNIKIPVYKDGKYQFVQLAHLTEQQIANFAKKQKQLQLEQDKKKQVQKQLQRKQKQNSLLKKQLQQKQRLLAKQQQDAKRQKLELLKAKQLAQQSKKISIVNQVKQRSQKSQDSYNDSDQKQSQDDDDDYGQENQDKQQEENYYQSDFQSMSMASAQKKSRISINSQKKHQQSESYGDSYDPDFESYSQSLLGSQQKLSMSQMSQSLRSVSPKKR